MKKVIVLCAVVLGVSAIILGALLLRHTFEQGERMNTNMKQPKMECTLTLETSKAKVGEDPAGEVAIKNVSKETLVIDYIADPFYNLDLQVFDGGGKKISLYYGSIYSNMNTEQLTLRPGETYRSTVAIFGAIDEPMSMPPGIYKITAIYECNIEQAVSKQVELTLTPK